MAIRFRFVDSTEHRQKNNPVMAIDFGRINSNGFGKNQYGYIAFRPAYPTFYEKAGVWSYDFYSHWFSNDMYGSENVLHYFTLKASFDWLNKENTWNYFGESFGYVDDDAFSILPNKWDAVSQKMRFAKRVAKGMNDIRELRGEIRGLGDMAQRFAEVLGITEFFYNTTVGYSSIKSYRVIEIGNIERAVEKGLNTNEMGY